MSNGSGLSRGDRNRNARLARLRELVPLHHAIVGIDLADDTQAAVVTDHDSRVIARRQVWAASHFPDSFICVISCCELPVQVLVVGFLRSPVTECRVETLAIIADLDVPGNVLPCFLSRRVRGPVHPLDLHRRVK